MRVGIDLLWVRTGICGGTESFIRNLLDGFAMYAQEWEYVLFTARDNAESFRHYEKNSCMRLHVCEVDCANQMKRILWENGRLDKEAAAEETDVMFIPVYSKPKTYGSRIPYVSVIHDLQALHYPEYFSLARRLFLKYTWRKTCRTSDRIITISDYCRKDLISHYPCVKDKIYTIYNPIISRASGMPAEFVEEKYGVRRGEYFYCVSSMLPHKNLDTIFKVLAERKQKGEKQDRLILSGVGGEENKARKLVAELDIADRVIFSGFVSDAERDCLYENCRLFLFPSIFEGFGMPPIEAMRRGKNVVMTEKSCLKEVTAGRAFYVKDPLDTEEWNERIIQALRAPGAEHPFHEYDLQNIVGQYVRVLGAGREV